MVTNAELLKKIERQNKRILALERATGLREERPRPVEVVETSSSVPNISLTFNQIITILGVVGLSIGVVSFFFYAVASGWIGKTAQVYIGVFVGFLLFGLGLFLRKDKEGWSNAVIGGAYVIEYIAVTVGVLYFGVLSNVFGLLLTILFLVSSVILSMKYESKLIAYFALAGGYLTPFITGYTSNLSFTMAYYLIISIGLVRISHTHSWPDLRAVSYAIVALHILNSLYELQMFTPKIVPILFFIAVFALYHYASIVSVLRKKVKLVDSLDSLILMSLPVLILYSLYDVLDWSMQQFGFIILFLAALYFVEFYVFKSKKLSVSDSLTYLTLATAVVLGNLGIISLCEELNMDYIMILFMTQFILFGSLFLRFPKINVYGAFSRIALGFTGLWYLFILRFDHGSTHALIFITILALFVASSYWLYTKNRTNAFNGAVFIVVGFLFIYSFHKYLWFIGVSDIVGQIVLSVLWLIYTLTLYAYAPKGARPLIWALLGITLLKIALRDLFFLTGASRIAGFIIFGILLIIGGYAIKHDK